MSKTESSLALRKEDRPGDAPLVTLDQDEADEGPARRSWFTGPSPWKETGKKIGMG